MQGQGWNPREEDKCGDGTDQDGEAQQGHLGGIAIDILQKESLINTFTLFTSHIPTPVAMSATPAAMTAAAAAAPGTNTAAAHWESLRGKRRSEKPSDCIRESVEKQQSSGTAGVD